MKKILINIVLSFLLGSFKKFALGVINELNSVDLGNDEKRAQAFEKIKAQAAQEGRSLQTRIINLVIELGVEYLKKRKSK